MATYKSRATSRIVLLKESAYKTAGSVGHVIRNSSFTFDGITEWIENNEATPTPAPARKIKGGMKRVTARLTACCNTQEFAILAYGFFGTYADTGAGDPYTHTYKQSTSTKPVSWAVEVQDSNVTKYDLFEGLVMKSFSFSGSKNDSRLLDIVIEFDASGDFALAGSSPKDASPDTYSVGLHALPACSVKIDNTATALIHTMNVTLSRTIFPLAAFDGNLVMTDFDAGDYMADITLTGWRDSADTLPGLDNAAEHTVEIISPRANDATHYISWDFNECDIEDTGTGEVGSDGPKARTLKVHPFYDNDAGASWCVLTVLTELADVEAIL